MSEDLVERITALEQQRARLERELEDARRRVQTLRWCNGPGLKPKAS